MPFVSWNRLKVERLRWILQQNHREDRIREGMRRAGVLMPLYSENGRLMAIYIRRTRHFLRDGREAVHSGQIAFPGGKIETGESSLQAALREAQEEIGLPAGSVEPLGALGEFSTLASFFVATVHVGWLAEKPELVRNRHEVAAIYTIPLDEIYPQHRRDVNLNRAADALSLHYHWQPPGERTPICIWGLTARITWCFLSLIEKDGSPVPFPAL